MNSLVRIGDRWFNLEQLLYARTEVAEEVESDGKTIPGYRWIGLQFPGVDCIHVRDADAQELLAILDQRAKANGPKNP